MKKHIFILFSYTLALSILGSATETMASDQSNQNMVTIKGGEYRPLYISRDSPKQHVSDFHIDTSAVTNQQFLNFVEQNPSWQPMNIASIFSEDKYLFHWQKSKGVYLPATELLESPVIYVSWFAAQAYCQSKSKRLPTVAEWEYVARASETQINGSEEPGYNQKILNWYGRPSLDNLAKTRSSKANVWGVFDLHGIIWEWTEDFNSSLVNGESRNDSVIDSALFCGAGAAGAADPKDYAAFMRFGFRSSLQAKFTLGTLGFRCAKSFDTKQERPR